MILSHHAFSARAQWYIVQSEHILMLTESVDSFGHKTTALEGIVRRLQFVKKSVQILIDTVDRDQ